MFSIEDTYSNVLAEAPTLADARGAAETVLRETEEIDRAYICVPGEPYPISSVEIDNYGHVVVMTTSLTRKYKERSYG